jgi:hypothetical protein
MPDILVGCVHATAGRPPPTPGGWSHEGPRAPASRSETRTRTSWRARTPSLVTLSPSTSAPCQLLEFAISCQISAPSTMAEVEGGAAQEPGLAREARERLGDAERDELGVGPFGAIPTFERPRTSSPSVRSAWPIVTYRAVTKVSRSALPTPEP